MFALLLASVLIAPEPYLNVSVEYREATLVTESIPVSSLSLDGVTIRDESDPVQIATESVPVAVFNVSTNIPKVRITSRTAKIRQIQTGKYFTTTPGKHWIRVTAFGLVGEGVEFDEWEQEITLEDKKELTEKKEEKKPEQRGIEAAQVSRPPDTVRPARQQPAAINSIKRNYTIPSSNQVGVECVGDT